MNIVDAGQASKELDRLVDEAADRHEPILIAGPRANAFLIGEAHLNSMQETLHLLSIPGMRESIQDGLKTPVQDCEDSAGW